MPIFEFRCPSCGAVTETILGNSEDRDKQQTRCPKCSVKMVPIPFSKTSPFQWAAGDKRWNS